jgi:LysM repeat protein
VVAQGPTLTGGQMTATQIVYGATATAAFLMGTQLPAPTPFGQQPVQPGQVLQPGQYPPNVTLVTATPLGQPGMCAEHRITIGETLTRIALTYGVTAQAIATANGIVNPDLIEAGDTLQIPCPAAAATPVPTVPGQTTTTTTTGQQVYIVQAGDNIYRISLRFGVDMGELVLLNGLNEVTMNTIYVGQQLTIPASAVIVATPGPGTPLPAPTLTPFIIVVTSAPPGTIG